MARKSNHDIVREWRSPHRTGLAITRTGLMLRKRRAGGTWTRTHPKPDLTLADLHVHLTAHGWERVVYRPHARPDSWVPNSTAKNEARLTAKAKRDAARQRKLDEQREAEAAVLRHGDDTVPEGIDANLMQGYVVASLRAGRKPLAGPLAYVYEMARFHGGATGGYLGTAIGAECHLPRDYPHREALDAIADAAARIVYGTDRAAAERWARALHG